MNFELLQHSSVRFRRITRQIRRERGCEAKIRPVRGETREKTVSRKEAEKCQFILALFTSDSSRRDKGESAAIAKQGCKG